MDNELSRRALLQGLACAVTLSVLTKQIEAAPMAKPFKINIGDDILLDLSGRLKRSRLPVTLKGSDWNYGAKREEVEALVADWQAFDWRSFEAKLNALPQFTANIDGNTIHFIHARSSSPRAIPLLLLHGWPSSVVQFVDIIPMLLDRGFDVVAPSLPGFAFSSIPKEPGMGVRRIAGFMSNLMFEVLGYKKYAGRGSDLGAGVLQQLAEAKPAELIGLHLSGTNPFIAYRPPDMTDEEKTFVATADQWMQREMAYAMLHSTKPQTLAFALNDSPIGLAAWIFEKFHAWTDQKSNVIGRYGREKLLANLTIYWATGTIGSSMNLYAETARDAEAKWGRVEVPTAMLMSAKDMFPTPRSWANRSWNVTRWTEIDRGGHFLEWEEPALVAEDIAKTFTK